MIYVAKPRRKVPKEFLTAARDEMKIVVPLFAKPGKKPPKYQFKAYRNKHLKATLEDLFKKKCAYCEATYNVTGSMEVEHYRPKSLYYWLAADWSNLLPSCNHCNNGKRSKFPLQDPQKQAKKPGQEKREEALLLNPSDPRPSRRPDRHLTFDPKDGSVQAIAQRGTPSPLGTASIEVYRLTHPGLSAARRDWTTRLRWHIQNCQKAMNGSAADREFAYQGLSSFLGPEQPFKALTVQILRHMGFKLPRTSRRKRRS